MGGYWVPVLLGALGIVALLAVAVISAAHVRRLQRVMGRAQRGTAAATVPLQVAAARLRSRRGDTGSSRPAP
ncbi:hypothetical protein GCM10009836_07680 [Pseudonocardia ailaonensis]|uniref:Uncharacterized protein n=1 Tax=Pseudonocardia ailaonensis TaxID=367279 RepID=A0ABN2MN91_9PSEU